MRTKRAVTQLSSTQVIRPNPICQKQRHAPYVGVGKHAKRILLPACDHQIASQVELEMAMSSDDEQLDLSVIEEPYGSLQAACHTHDLDGVLICDRFLLGECHAGLTCSHHHTPKPYHWQLRLKKSQRWFRLGPTAQEHLERNYCNANTDKVTLKIRDGSSSEMDLKSLSLTFKKYDCARRLCNSSDPSVNPYFPAEWQVYWKDQDRWKVYEEDISKQLNAAFERGESNCALEIQGQVYYVDLKGFTQCNVKTQFTREIRHRPIYRSYQSIAPFLKTYIYPDALHDQHVNTDTFPATWVMEPWDPATPFLKVPVHRMEVAYRKIETHFHKTLFEDQAMIFSIHRIQNKTMWQKYACQKNCMSNGLSDAEKILLEKYLYHGTTEDTVDKICQQNFDPRVSGVNGTIHGQGSYFALEASYSHIYTRRSETGFRYMFLAKVLIGKMALGKASYRRPPTIEGSLALYDSCVDNLLNPKIYVVFDNCQCYPFFLIQYKLLSEPILVNE